MELFIPSENDVHLTPQLIHCEGGRGLLLLTLELLVQMFTLWYIVVYSNNNGCYVVKMSIFGK